MPKFKYSLSTADYGLIPVTEEATISNNVRLIGKPVVVNTSGTGATWALAARKKAGRLLSPDIMAR